MWTDDSGLQFARADTSGNWSKPIVIDSTITISPSQMVLLDSGEAFAAFANGVKIFTPRNSLWSWTHPLLTDQNASSDPRIVADESGNALVAWTQTVNGIDRNLCETLSRQQGLVWFRTDRYRRYIRRRAAGIISATRWQRRCCMVAE